MGTYVAPAGDVNGDGYDNIMVAAILFDNGQTDEGRAYLFLGSPTGPGTTPDWTAEGDQAGARFGWSISALAMSMVTATTTSPSRPISTITPTRTRARPSSTSDRPPAPLLHLLGRHTVSSPTCDTATPWPRWATSTATGSTISPSAPSGTATASLPRAGLSSMPGRHRVSRRPPPGHSNRTGWRESESRSWCGRRQRRRLRRCHRRRRQLRQRPDQRGRAYLLLGSAAGLNTTPVWTAKGDQSFAQFGFCVGTQVTSMAAVMTISWPSSDV